MQSKLRFAAALSSTIAALGLLLWSLGPGPPRACPIRVPEGATLRSIGQLLVEAGALRTSAGFLVLGRLMGVERQLRAGQFTIPPRSTPAEIVRLLVRGKMDLNEVTIPEGLTVWETASLLARAAEVDSARFVEAAVDSAVAAAFGVPGPTLEGYLFPETYDLPPRAPVGQVLAILVSKAHGVLAEVLAGRRLPPPLGARGELVVLASIVESEARAGEERPRIAAVYLNRLRGGMRLEADPTVSYALRERRRLYYKDLEVDSPWNTYRVPGLPPTPICSPGRESLEAVITAPSGTGELYFVARGDGTHIFSRTAEDHERAVRLVRTSAELVGGTGPSPPSAAPAAAEDETDKRGSERTPARGRPRGAPEPAGGGGTS